MIKATEDGSTLLQEESAGSLRGSYYTENFSESIPHDVIRRAERLGINTNIIVGREMTDIGEIGWLVNIKEETASHNYQLFARMRIEEGYTDGEGFQWQARIWILPIQVLENDREIILPDQIRNMGYEILLNLPSNTKNINIGIDSICDTGMHHGGHIASNGDPTLGCDCLGQLEQRRHYIAERGGIEFIGLGEGGRGNGMNAETAQIHSQNLAKQHGQPIPGTFTVAQSMGYPADRRPLTAFIYPLLAKWLFGITGDVIIPTNNPNKIAPFEEFGMSVTTVPVVDPQNPDYYDGQNAQDKRSAGGHNLPTSSTHQEAILPSSRRKRLIGKEEDDTAA